MREGGGEASGGGDGGEEGPPKGFIVSAMRSIGLCVSEQVLIPDQVETASPAILLRAINDLPVKRKDD